MMNKETKKNYIDEMKKVFSSNDAVMIAHYQGLNVIQLDALRKELRENEVSKEYSGRRKERRYFARLVAMGWHSNAAGWFLSLWVFPSSELGT